MTAPSMPMCDQPRASPGHAGDRRERAADDADGASMQTGGGNSDVQNALARRRPARNTKQGTPQAPRHSAPARSATQGGKDQRLKSTA